MDAYLTLKFFSLSQSDLIVKIFKAKFGQNAECAIYRSEGPYTWCTADPILLDYKGQLENDET